MKCALVFLLVCGVVAIATAQRDQVWGRPQGNTQGNNRPGQRPQTRPTPAPPAPAPAPAFSAIDGNGQLIGCPCRTTQENNLVCGTDGLTYGNMGELRCAQKCKDVQLLHGGSCSAREPLEQVVPGK